MARTLVLVAVLLAASAGATTGGDHADHPQPLPAPGVAAGDPNSGLPSISDNTARLDPNALLSLTFPPTFWAGCVAARTGCDATASGCWTGSAPPATIVQVTVHDGGSLDQATWQPRRRGCGVPWPTGVLQEPVPAHPDHAHRRRARPAELPRPGELRVVFCQATIVTGDAAAAAAAAEGEMVIRSVVADS
ncbi:unnamed protein product [Miscanthus lutarioriparius]|uniref:Uncharacterized protein n=1 Tax=Miscanthus lutarioriparius TaxID=422564 RepID=A0A811SLL3_9POAL|nr:unnamed protein product [Miscanthus lutarioriparius]